MPTNKIAAPTEITGVNQRYERDIIAHPLKDHPKLALIRLDPERAEIWGDASSFIAGAKLLLGIDPKADYKDKVAEVGLR